MTKLCQLLQRAVQEVVCLWSPQLWEAFLYSWYVPVEESDEVQGVSMALCRLPCSACPYYNLRMAMVATAIVATLTATVMVYTEETHTVLTPFPGNGSLLEHEMGGM